VVLVATNKKEKEKFHRRFLIPKRDKKIDA
jgi:hypothetical protein